MCIYLWQEYRFTQLTQNIVLTKHTVLRNENEHTRLISEQYQNQIKNNNQPEIYRNDFIKR